MQVPTITSIGPESNHIHIDGSAAIVLYEINHLYKIGGNDSQIENIIWDYASISRSLQKLPAIGGIGEPKFNIDGSLFNEPWCRPQTDGPALEASLLIDFSFNYLEKGGSIEKISELYDSKLPTDSIIKTCLEYISHYWDQNTCDLVILSTFDNFSGRKLLVTFFIQEWFNGLPFF